MMRGGRALSPLVFAGLSSVLLLTLWPRLAAPPFWDEHSFDEVRFYNVSCLIFGSNPDVYMPLVTRGVLPKQRAVRCADEYKKTVASWDKLLEPYGTKPGTAPPPQQVASQGGGWTSSSGGAASAGKTSGGGWTSGEAKAPPSSGGWTSGGTKTETKEGGGWK